MGAVSAAAFGGSIGFKGASHMAGSQTGVDGSCVCVGGPIEKALEEMPKSQLLGECAYGGGGRMMGPGALITTGLAVVWIGPGEEEEKETLYTDDTGACAGDGLPLG